jgi:transmembrane secretion effector
VRLPRSLEVFREGNFARYVAAVTISQLGTGMALVALAFAVLEFGGATDLGIVLLAREIPIIVFVLLGGVFADRLPRRSILVSTEVAKASAQLLTAALLVTGAANVWNVALLQTVFGVASAFARPASIGLVKEAVSNERLQEANALLSLARNVLLIAGPALGAIVVALGSPALAIAFDAATFLVSAALIASMRIVTSVRLATSSILGDLQAGWQEFIGRPWAVAMIASFGLFQLTYFPALNVLGPVVAKSSLGGAPAWGTILAASSAGAVLGGLLALRIRVRRPLVACQLAVLPSGLLLAALAIPAPVAIIAAAGAVVGAGFALGGTLWETALQRNVPDHALSRLSSYDWFGSVALNPVGYAVIGPVAAAFGTPETLVASAVLNVAVLIGVVLLPSVRAIRMTPVATEGAVAGAVR